MTGFRKGLALVAVAAGLIIGLAACGGESGGGGGGGGSDSGGEPTTYQNAIYGFELTYSDPLRQSKASTTGDEKYAVAFADKKGAEVDDAYVNGVRVAVSEMEHSAKPAQVRKMKAEMTKVMEKMVADNDGEQIGEVVPAEAGGIPGYRVEFTAETSGVVIHYRVTFLFHGKLLFDFTEQAVVEDWDSLAPTLDAVTQSFTLD